MFNRKILLLLLCTIIFGIVVIVWYFFERSSSTDPTITDATNPFGEATNVIRPKGEFIRGSNKDSGSGTETERTPASERVLTQIWDKPTAGFSFITREILVEPQATTTASSTSGTSSPQKLPKPYKKTVSYILFVDRTTGHVYGYNKETNSVFQISNSTIPGVYDAYILQNGTKVVMRTFDETSQTIKTISATIPSFIEGSDPRPLGTLQSLQDNISSFAVSDSGNSFSFIVPTINGSALYTVDQKGKMTTASSPLREWTLTYGGEAVYMTNKPSAYLEGTTFSLPAKTYVLGGKTGLMSTVSAAGDTVFASMWSTTGLTSFLFSKKTGQSSTLNIQTLASKCLWVATDRLLCGVPNNLKDGEEGLPDDWFQGSISFSDDVYYVDTEEKVGKLLYQVSQESGSPFDMIRLAFNQKTSLLGFINKTNGTFWLLNVEAVLPSL